MKQIQIEYVECTQEFGVESVHDDGTIREEETYYTADIQDALDTCRDIAARCGCPAQLETISIDKDSE